MQQATVPYYKVTQFYYYGVIIDECQCKYRAQGEVLIFWYLKKVSQNILVLVWLISLSEHTLTTKTLWNISKYTPNNIKAFRNVSVSQLLMGAWVWFWGLRLYKIRSGWSKSAILAQNESQNLLTDIFETSKYQNLLIFALKLLDYAFFCTFVSVREKLQ